MLLEQLSEIAQVVGSVGVILSLVFVGMQIRHNTAALYRNEHNSTMSQWTVIRMAIVQNHDIAQLMSTGINSESALDPVSQLRLEQMLSEAAWASFHIWDRTQRGVFPPGTFELTAGEYLNIVLATPRGSAWWRTAKTIGFVPQFVVDVDAVLAKKAAANQPQAKLSPNLSADGVLAGSA